MLLEDTEMHDPPPPLATSTLLSSVELFKISCFSKDCPLMLAMSKNCSHSCN